MSINPVFYHKGGFLNEENDQEGWYFYNETWSEAIGPYQFEEQARKMLKEYAEAL